jgi:FixJ family two-component response regulator
MQVARKQLEKAILHKLVQGTTLPQIAREFGLSLAEASRYRDRICRHLRLNRPGVREYSRAVGLAMPWPKPR